MLITNMIVEHKYRTQKNFFKINTQSALVNLGSVKYVLMDKTGTITKNDIQLESIFTMNNLYNIN